MKDDVKEMNDEDKQRQLSCANRTKLQEAFDIEITPTDWRTIITMGQLKPGSVVTGDHVFDYEKFDILERMIFHIPDNVQFEGSLVLKGFPDMTTLPKYLKVKGDLQIVGGKIKELPPGLEVGGVLDLTGNAFPVKIGEDTRIGIWMEGGK